MIANDVWVAVSLYQQADFSPSSWMKCNKHAFYSHWALIKKAPQNEGAVTAESDRRLGDCKPTHKLVRNSINDYFAGLYRVLLLKTGKSVFSVT
jgi:hypothetical protein